MIQNEKHIVKARVWLWEGKGAWHFITIEKDQAKDIKKDYHWPQRGFGSIPVKVTLRKTSWQTSIFPEKEGMYILPIKKEVRLKENIQIGKTITLKLLVVT